MEEVQSYIELSAQIKELLSTECVNQHREQKTLNETLKILCTNCPYKSTSKNDLNKHKQNVHAANTQSCPKCEKLFYKKADLKKHILSVHDDNRQYNCTHCNYQATRKDTLTYHLNSVHLKIRYTCSNCDKQFTRKHQRRLHQERTHGKSGLRDLPLPKIERRWFPGNKVVEKESFQTLKLASNKSKLTVHTNSEHEQKIHHCRLCNHQTYHKNSLYHHIEEVHRNRFDQPVWEKEHTEMDGEPKNSVMIDALTLTTNTPALFM